MGIIYNVLLWILVYCQAGLSQKENCESALGMENKRIPDDSITASSSLSSRHRPALGRLDGRGAWCSGPEESPYIQISLDEEKLITVLKTQGSRMDTAWARKYEIKYLKGGNWTSYHKELLGNRNSGSFKMNVFQPPIKTRSIRIYPKQPVSASPDPNAILVPCLRLELYGCSAPAECKDPGRPGNGERRGSDFNHGKQVTFFCKQGFVLIGSATSVCHKGKWSHGVPECKGSCKDPGIPNNGKRRGDTFVDGYSVEFTCLERYTLIGPSVIRCLGDKWSSAIPQCKASCPDPNVPQNGNRIGANFGHGHSVQFTCKSGFWLVGSRLIVCDEGTWSNPLPECRAVCSNPGVPANGERIGDDFGDGQMVAYRCNSGFNLVGSPTAFCVAGQWNSSQPTCKASCRDPGVPQNGRRVGSNFGHGNEVTFVCHLEFSLIGSSSITCHDGKWSSFVPVCKASCKNPGTPGNGVSHGNDFSHNKQVRFSCLRGFQLSGSSSVIVCINGRWSGPVPDCKAVCTAPRTPVNGERIGSSFLDGQQVAFRCRSGYTMIGSQVIRCVKGKWDKTEPACTALCPSPSVPQNGRMLGMVSSTRHGDKMNYSCDAGFKMEGFPTITCIDGKWNSPAPLCKDINECSEGFSDCDGRALCKNTEGSYTCTCTGDTVGDGKSCTTVCSAPKTPVNGERIGSSFLDGRRVTFRCRPGYTLIGSQVMRCVKGKWNNVEPVCRAMCSDPSIPKNGRILDTPFSKRHGGKVKYACDSGFKMEGSSTSTCVDGKWSSPAPLCKDINECSEGLSDCDRRSLCKNTEGSYICTCTGGTVGDGKSCTKLCADPGFPANGGREGSDFSDGKTVTFICQPGYKMVGRRTIRCLGGLWSSALPKCLKPCADPGFPTNGGRKGNDFSDGKTVRFTCQPGYKMVGRRTIRCQGGLWSSAPPKCQRLCKIPKSPAHGLIIKDRFDPDGIIEFACDSGFKLIGSSVLRCVGGRWNNSRPQCRIKLCTDPGFPTNGGRKGNDFSDGKKVTFTCQRGYQMVGRRTIRCQDGFWSSAPPKCLKVCSPPSNIPHGSYEGKNFASGGSVRYSCDVRYTLDGPSLLSCVDGNWNGVAPVCRAPCTPPYSPLNGFVFGDSPLHQATVQYWCEEGFTLQGSSSRQCIDGKWDFPAPVCEEPSTNSSCPKPRIPPNAYMLFSLSQRKWFNNGDQVLYRCLLGYSPLGLNFHRCRNGQWTRLSFKCIERSCGHPGEPTNGKIDGWEFTYKSKVKYLCNNGYFLVGPRERICQANQTWTGMQPKCSKVNCGALPTPINAEKILETSTLFQGQVEFQCIGRRFKLVGPSTRTCLISGRWSGQQPRCRLIVCGDPGTPDHGSKVVHRGFYYGGYIEFSCKPGYVLEGYQRIYCTKSGSWSNSKPRCLER